MSEIFVSAIVRIFSHSSIVTAPVSPGSGRFSSDSISQLKQPPEGREMFTVGDISASTSAAATATNATRLLLIQVQPGKRVHYEVSPSGTVTAATTTSPICSGDTVIQFGPSWQVSFLENTEV